jgi:uncharacterized membrane protein YeaQ/YmgE (transglycosylase-associated protein family)
MGYLWSIVIGSAIGWIGGRLMKREEYGARVDVMAGMVGGFLSALLVHVLSDGVGIVWGVLIAIIGASLLLVGMRRFLKPAPLPILRPPR